MSYTLEDFRNDHNLSREGIDEAKGRMLEQMRLYELQETRKAQERGGTFSVSAPLPFPGRRRL